MNIIDTILEEFGDPPLIPHTGDLSYEDSKGMRRLYHYHKGEWFHPDELDSGNYYLSARAIDALEHNGRGGKNARVRIPASRLQPVCPPEHAWRIVEDEDEDEPKRIKPNPYRVHKPRLAI